MSFINIYEKIKINSDISEENLQRVFFALMRKYHPDVYKGNPEIAEKKTKLIIDIFEILSDPRKRAEHDAYFGFSSSNIYIYGKKDKTIIIQPSNSIQFKGFTTSISDQLMNKVIDGRYDPYKLSPREFEEVVAEIYYKFGKYDVKLTPATRDGGKDIIVSYNNELGDFVHYVQCKKNRSDRPVDVATVRDLFGTISLSQATAGVIVTTSYFSSDAICEVQNIENRISLKKFYDLVNSIKQNT